MQFPMLWLFHLSCILSNKMEVAFFPSFLSTFRYIKCGSYVFLSLQEMTFFNQEYNSTFPEWTYFPSSLWISPALTEKLLLRTHHFLFQKQRNTHKGTQKQCQKQEFCWCWKPGPHTNQYQQDKHTFLPAFQGAQLFKQSKNNKNYYHSFYFSKCGWVSFFWSW